jgi:hypothetical protein
MLFDATFNNVSVDQKGLFFIVEKFKKLRYIVAVSIIGGGNKSTQRKPPTCRKSLTNFSGDRH